LWQWELGAVIAVCKAVGVGVLVGAVCNKAVGAVGAVVAVCKAVGVGVLVGAVCNKAVGVGAVGAVGAVKLRKNWEV
jgi:hypothetical protein